MATSTPPDQTDLVDLDAMRRTHHQAWDSVADEVWGAPGICSECQQVWPCDVARLLDHIEHLTQAAAPAEATR